MVVDHTTLSFCKEGKTILKKTNYLNLIVPLIFAFVLFKVINSTDFFKSFMNLVTPFIWAFIIAYLLNPLLTLFERKLKFGRIGSLIIVYILLVGLITLLVTFVTPKIIESIKVIKNNLPEYFSNTENWLITQSSKLSFLNRYGVIDLLDENLNNIIDKFSGDISSTLSNIISSLINITSALLNFVLGIVISIYMLKDKEFFSRQVKKLMYALYNTNKVEYLINLGKELNFVFSKYLIGKLIDSMIIGILCFVGLLIFRAPHALVISAIVGITNMIPYFGPFIGMIPAVIITLFYSPIKALWVVIFILALQQFDGLYLGPKILGTQVGLKPFWVISAIIIGGGLFGVLGMLLAIPISGMIRVVLNKYIEAKLKDKNLEF